jgi:hypothetical protein
MNLREPNLEMPPIATDGIRFLARMWAGAGSLHDWLVPAEWNVSRKWSADVVRARFAESILWGAERTIAPRFPLSSAAWMDQFEAQLIRNTAYTDLPTAHTDWALTLSQFGRYPSPQYVDRRPVSTLESALSRVSLWLAAAISRAEALIMSQFGRVALSDDGRARLTTPARVARILALTAPDRLFEQDLVVCGSAGGCWPLVARLARQLSGVWTRDAITQLSLLPPMLPDLGSQLFELATLGTCATTINSGRPNAQWSSLAPIGAAQHQQSCLTCWDNEFKCDVYYQIIPAGRKAATGPYQTLGAALNVQSLRPDVWILFQRPFGNIELVIESKYSLNTSYIASGITQVLGYSQEHALPTGWRRLYMVVAPKEVVNTFTSWENKFFLGNLDHLTDLIGRIETGAI